MDSAAGFDNRPGRCAAGKKLHLRARDVAVAVRVLFEVVLVVLLGGIVVLERADLHKEFSLRPRSISAMRFTVSFALSLV